MFLLKIKKIKDLLIPFLYKYLCKVYQKISTLYENLFLRKNNAEENFENKGIFYHKLQNKISLKGFDDIQEIKINDYLTIKKFTNSQIEDLLKKCFTNDFKEKITFLTGFKYSIDFIICYERQFIPLEERDVPTLNQAYSYVGHFDKPNSSNMLKVFIPLNISEDHGPLEVLSKKDSKRINKNKNLKLKQNKTFFTGQGDILHCFSPTVCFHRDGIPNENLKSSQIMFQLNPNKDWTINTRIFLKDSLKSKFGIWTTEPKFPFFAYFFDKRISFHEIYINKNKKKYPN